MYFLLKMGDAPYLCSFTKGYLGGSFIIFWIFTPTVFGEDFQFDSFD